MARKTHRQISGTLLLFASLFVLCGTFAAAQNTGKSKGESFSKELKSQEPAARITRYEVRKDHQEKFRKALKEYISAALSNEENIMAEAYFEQENQSVIWLFERWENQKELDKFRKNSKAKAVLKLAKTALVKPEKIISIKDLEPISKEQWRRASKTEDEQLTIMLFVDAKAGTEENFKEVYHKAMPQFRSEPGVVTYQLSQLEEDHTQFVTFEKFRSKDAFGYHLKFPPIQPVLDYLNTSIKTQPFQDGIHNLIEFAPLIRE